MSHTRMGDNNVINNEIFVFPEKELLSTLAFACKKKYFPSSYFQADG